MPLLNPQSYSKTYKIDEIDSITFKGIQGITSHPSENKWFNPIIIIHTKEEKEKEADWEKVTEYIEHRKSTDEYAIRRKLGNGWSHGYGIYDTLEEAEAMVELLEKHDWDKDVCLFKQEDEE
ncbi:MAG: hypothetical protein IJF83_03210 [Methanobrevibacter sp.]|nr:hypothetical protein [Methanobrevibacter sp.]